MPNPFTRHGLDGIDAVQLLACAFRPGSTCWLVARGSMVCALPSVGALATSAPRRMNAWYLLVTFMRIFDVLYCRWVTRLWLLEPWRGFFISVVPPTVRTGTYE